MKKVAKLACMIAVAVLGSIGIDRAIGMLLHKNEPEGLLFPPHSKAHYQTSEFSYDSFVNSLGFRDREFNAVKGADIRVAAIGDSFTYGWGVNLEQSWPKVLERNLREKGFRVEIANLGRPGAGPRNYAETAEKAIPLLKPDLVVVAVLQGDDLAQSGPTRAEAGSASHALSNIGALISGMPGSVYPNLTRLATVVAAWVERDHPRVARLILRMVGEESVASAWKSEQEKILAEFTPEERERYEKFDRLIKLAFVNGNLNPALIRLAIKDPDYFWRTFDIRQPIVKVRIDVMSEQFARIKKMADRYNARVIVVVVPFGLYVSPIEYETWREYGFSLDKAMLTSDSPDQAIKLACDEAGLPFFSVTARFRKNQNTHFFYELDGHFNAAGQQFYADQLTPIMGQFVKARMEGSFYVTDLKTFWKWHSTSGAAASILLTEMADTRRYGRVLVDADGRVLKFEEKNGRSGPGWINAGVYLCRRRLLETIPPNHTVSLEREIFPSWIGAGLYGFRSEGRFLDIGVPQAYSLAERFFASLTI